MLKRLKDLKTLGKPVDCDPTLKLHHKHVTQPLVNYFGIKPWDSALGQIIGPFLVIHPWDIFGPKFGTCSQTPFQPHWTILTITELLMHLKMKNQSRIMDGCTDRRMRWRVHFLSWFAAKKVFSFSKKVFQKVNSSTLLHLKTFLNLYGLGFSNLRKWSNK